MAWYKNITVEVPIFLVMFSMILQGGVMSNLNIYRTCYVILGFNETECADLGKISNNETQALEKKVQPTINKMTMVGDIGTFATLFFTIYIGIWADKFGRKPFLLLYLTCTTVSSSILTVFMFFHYVSPWWFLICQVPMIFAGNYTTFFILTIAYLTDITSSKDRMIRMAIFQALVAAAQSLSGFLTPIVVYGTSYEVIFCSITGLYIISLLYTLFFIPESLPREKEEFHLGNLLKYINFTEMFQVMWKKRPNKGRLHVIINLTISVISGFVIGEISVNSLFLRVKLGFTLTKISMMSSVTSVAGVAFTAFGTYMFYSKLKIKEIPIAVFSGLANVTANILKLIATHDYEIYIASTFSILSSLGSLMLRTLLTFMVAPDEVGKIVALLNILSSLCSTLANFIYPLVYNATININPSLFNLLSLGVHCITTIMLICLLWTKIPIYIPPPEDEKDETKDEKPKKISMVMSEYN